MKVARPVLGVAKEEERAGRVAPIDRSMPHWACSPWTHVGRPSRRRMGAAIQMSIVEGYVEVVVREGLSQTWTGRHR